MSLNIINIYNNKSKLLYSIPYDNVKINKLKQLLEIDDNIIKYIVSTKSINIYINSNDILNIVDIINNIFINLNNEIIMRKLIFNINDNNAILIAFEKIFKELKEFIYLLLPKSNIFEEKDIIFINIIKDIDLLNTQLLISNITKYINTFINMYFSKSINIKDINKFINIILNDKNIDIDNTYVLINDSNTIVIAINSKKAYMLTNKDEEVLEDINYSYRKIRKNIYKLDIE